jgi:flagellar protein FliS
MRNPAATYRQLSVEGASPVGLVVMLYERAIVDLHRAMMAIEAHDIEQRTKHVDHFFGVTAELEGSLDRARGGQVAENLAAFYRSARAEALNASAKNSKEILSKLAEHFSTLRDAWREGERHLAAQSLSLPAHGRSAGSEGSDAGTVALSIFD